MGAFVELLNALFGEGDGHGRQAATPSRLLIGPSAQAGGAIVIGPSPRAVVEKVRRPVWDEREWVRTSDDRGREVYVGHFQVRHRGTLRRFPGRIVKTRSELKAYIADPPPEIRRHPKGPCFALTQPPWFRVHWHRAPKNIDDAILYVEGVIDQSLNG